MAVQLEMEGDASKSAVAEMPVEPESVATPKMARKRRSADDNLAADDELWVDWGCLADGPWGRQSLITDEKTMSDLIGWATRLEAAPADNPLAILPNLPLRPSLLSFVHDEMVKILVATKEHDLWESFDTSALVALGVALEEMLTASLLPLAEQHVRRCRSLESEDDQAFVEWTLPPEEAVLKLSKITTNNFACSAGGLPTSRPATRTLVSDVDTNATTEDATAAVASWCRLHGSSLEDAQKTWNIHRLFLPAIHEDVRQRLKKRKRWKPKQQQSSDKDSDEQQQKPRATESVMVATDTATIGSKRSRRTKVTIDV